MNKVKIEKKQIEQKKYIFYCDLCDKKIKESYECEDGYIDEPDSLDIRVFIDGNCYELNEDLCIKCKTKRKEEIIKAFKELGFRKEC